MKIFINNNLSYILDELLNEILDKYSSSVEFIKNINCKKSDISVHIQTDLFNLDSITYISLYKIGKPLIINIDLSKSEKPTKDCPVDIHVYTIRNFNEKNTIMRITNGNISDKSSYEYMISNWHFEVIDMILKKYKNSIKDFLSNDEVSNIILKDDNLFHKVRFSIEIQNRDDKVLIWIESYDRLADNLHYSTNFSVLIDDITDLPEDD